MRITRALDDDLVLEAQRLTGSTEKTALVREALRALMERESARRPEPLPKVPVWSDRLQRMDPARVVFAHDHPIWQP